MISSIMKYPVSVCRKYLRTLLIGSHGTGKSTLLEKSATILSPYSSLISLPGINTKASTIWTSISDTFDCATSNTDGLGLICFDDCDKFLKFPNFFEQFFDQAEAKMGSGYEIWSEPTDSTFQSMSISGSCIAALVPQFGQFKY